MIEIIYIPAPTQLATYSFTVSPSVNGNKHRLDTVGLGLPIDFFNLR